MRNEIVSKIKEKDLVDVQKILLTVFNKDLEYPQIRKYYNQSMRNKNIHLYGYYINDTLVGTIMLDIAVLPVGKKATIWDLAVLEEYRNQGIATKLINKVEDIIRKDKDINKIWLFSNVKREDAHRLYKKLGYNGNDNKAFYKILN